MPLIIQSLPALVPRYDNSASSTHQSSLTSPVAFTWTHSVNTGGAYAIVCVADGFVAGSTPMPPSTMTSTAVTLGGVALSSLGVAANNNTESVGWTWVFGGNVSAAGTGAKTVSVTLTQAGTNFDGWGASFTYSGVTSVGPLQTAFGSSASPLLSVPSSIGHIVWANLNNSNPFSNVTFSAFSLTTRQSKSGAVPQFVAGDTAGATSVTVSAAYNSTDTWSAVGLDLI